MKTEGMSEAEINEKHAEKMRRKKVEWLVLLEDDEPGVARGLDARFEPLQEFGEGDSAVRVYRLPEDR